MRDMAVPLVWLLLASVSPWLLGVASANDPHFVSQAEATELRERVRSMFYHAYGGYMAHAFPLDELRPLSCSGEDSLGGYSLTLIDALDTLALLGNRTEFARQVRWLGRHLSFDKNKTVSLFETNIRILGGLLAAHLIASDDATGMYVHGYANELLVLAEDLARRLLPAFDTPTGIPYGSVNLRYGVSPDESEVTATACGGTLLLEFGVLSRITGDPVYEQVAKASLRALWERRSSLGLVGAHINILSGDWTHKDAGVGTSIDSFYEYLLKGHVLLGDEDCFRIFREAYDAVLQHAFQDPWYVEVNMDAGVLVWPLFNSLQAFWPGLQVLVGDIERAVRTHRAFFSVWRRFGFTPEGFNLQHGVVQPGQQSYPLRPELAESTYWLYKATRDPWYLEVGRDIVASLELARCPCGYCHISDVETHSFSDHMESFFLSETVKYLYLLFDLAASYGDNLLDNGPYRYVLNTEGHMLPLTPEIALPAATHHCAYLGSFCGAPKSSSCRWLEGEEEEGEEVSAGGNTTQVGALTEPPQLPVGPASASPSTVGTRHTAEDGVERGRRVPALDHEEGASVGDGGDRTEDAMQGEDSAAQHLDKEEQHQADEHRCHGPTFWRALGLDVGAASPAL